MSASPNSPHLVKGGIVTMDPDTTAPKSVIALHYNPDSLTRTLQIQAVRRAEAALVWLGCACVGRRRNHQLDALDEFGVGSAGVGRFGVQVVRGMGRGLKP
jgi:hypothetical protein